jgi:hypothetical protein
MLSSHRLDATTIWGEGFFSHGLNTDKTRIIFTPGIVGQNLCGCQSKSKPKHHLQIFGRLRGNRASRGQTKIADRNATVPTAKKDARDFREISGVSRGRFL